ncbi:hypothetical protein [Pseudoclavibacter sp. 13-3]|uniref:hypothetical protein n=1 Tax=Pseudoclavibacter sp. 13-3 TaxID=2901228 RepID=UPI001E58C97D|nr:hypothetical protein [Pseudoclavibacter sp. 13-3]MCD7101955.1 hypothetical protein [Pseudoclavibacter sp. 13-3]
MSVESIAGTEPPTWAVAADLSPRHAGGRYVGAWAGTKPVRARYEAEVLSTGVVLDAEVVLEASDGSDLDGTEVDPALVPAVIAALQAVAITEEQREVRRPVSRCVEPQQDGRGGGL